MLELVLGDTLTHRSGTADTAGDHLQHVIHVVGATPFLVGDHIDAILHLGLLYQLAVSTHSVLGVVLREGVGDERGGVQTGKGDELPAVSQLTKSLDVCLLLVAGHGLLPVERRRQVVCQPGNMLASTACGKSKIAKLTSALARPRGRRRRIPSPGRSQEVCSPSRSGPQMGYRQRHG